jgi:hypothetical protein
MYIYKCTLNVHNFKVFWKPLSIYRSMFQGAFMIAPRSSLHEIFCPRTLLCLGLYLVHNLKKGIPFNDTLDE